MDTFCRFCINAVKDVVGVAITTAVDVSLVRGVFVVIVICVGVVFVVFMVVKVRLVGVGSVAVVVDFWVIIGTTV